MGVYGAFSPSVFGMLSQSQALNTIGINIANVSTGGYRARETRFSTLLSESMFNESDLNGVRPQEIQRIDKQGLLQSSDSPYDLGIAGRGFFILSDTFDQSGRTFYGRDGSFQMRTVNDISVTADDGSTITVRDGYLADKNGYFVLGWEPDANGQFPTSGGTLTPLRIDPYAFSDQFEPTTTADLVVNLPANDDAGEVETYAVSVVDSNGDRQTVTFNFTKGSTLNQWDMTAITSQDAVSQVDTITLAGTIEAGDVYSATVNGNTITYTCTGAEADLDAVRDGLITNLNNNPTVSSLVTAAAGAGTGELTVTANTAGSAITVTSSATDGGGTADNTAAAVTTTANATATQTSAATTLTFDGTGAIVSPDTATMALGFAGGGTATIDIDVSQMTQYAGRFLPHYFNRNGFAASHMESFTFDADGHVVGTFEDSTQRILYKVPMAIFSNPNSMEEKNGNVYIPTPDTGDVEVVGAGSLGAGVFMPSTRELSNVDIASEFTTMMLTQHAYNSSATVFKTVDEMTEVIRDLKR